MCLDLGAPDYYEDPIHRIDMVGYLNIDAWRIGLKLQILLDWPSVIRTGDVTVEENYAGRSIGLTVNWPP